VPSEVLEPRQTWKNQTAYDEKARYLSRLFHENFKQYEAGVSNEVKSSGPIVD